MSQPNDKSEKKSPFWSVAKWSICVAVLFFVGWRAYALWTKDEFEAVDLQYRWLLPAMTVYLAAWIPSVWFWKQLLNNTGHAPSTKNLIRSYYCGHMGKYIPGKAMVLVIRSALLKSENVDYRSSALTATYETLWMMGTGSLIAVCSFPSLFLPALIEEAPWLNWSIPLIAIGITLCLLPILSRLLSKVTRWMLAKNAHLEGDSRMVNTQLLFQGLLIYLVTWSMLGLSLGLILRSVSASVSFADGFFLVGAVAAANVLGFAALFAPGGIGIREGILMEILQTHSQIGQRQAVLVAVLLRLVWLTAEILATVLLYYGFPSSPKNEQHE